MGYGVSLVEGGMIATVAPHQLGSDICLSGSSAASMNVTYNYAPVFAAVLGNGFRAAFHEVAARNTIELLESAIKTCESHAVVVLSEALAEQVRKASAREIGGYWLPKAENVLVILQAMLEWAKQNPDAVWNIS